MRKLVFVLFVILTTSACAQLPGYSTLENPYGHFFKEFTDHQLKGQIRSLLVYKKENTNFHGQTMTIKLEEGLPNCQLIVLDSNDISEVRFLNTDSTLRSKQIFKNGLIQKFEFYEPGQRSKVQHIFEYDNVGRLTGKQIINDNLNFNVKYSYDKRNRLISATGNELYDYKYVYDKKGGFYEIKYTEYKGIITIHESRYNKNTDTETLHVILQIEPKIKFEDVKKLKPSWQILSRFDKQHRVIFEQSKDLKLNEIELESSYSFNENDQLVAKTFKSKHGTNDTYTFVYSDNKLISQVAKDVSGYETFSQELKYNDKGDLMIQVQNGGLVKSELYTYEYVYDNQNNWIEKKETINGKLFQITYRQIQYKE